jgi:hypothetical protein
MEMVFSSANVTDRGDRWPEWQIPGAPLHAGGAALTSCWTPEAVRICVYRVFAISGSAIARIETAPTLPCCARTVRACAFSRGSFFRKSIFWFGSYHFTPEQPAMSIGNTAAGTAQRWSCGGALNLISRPAYEKLRAMRARIQA